MKISGRRQFLVLAGFLLLAAGELAVAGPAPSIDEQVLYRFCPQKNCDGGVHPHAGLIMDGAGNLYGTAAEGGVYNVSYGGGTVFKLAPNGGTGWTETVLYSFCSQTGCTDGDFPYAALIVDGAGNLYGTTYFGGSLNAGTVYRPSQTSTGWSQTVLYSFCSQTGCTDGAGPAAGLIMDGAGNLYGTTQGLGGGSYGYGTVFKL